MGAWIKMLSDLLHQDQKNVETDKTQNICDAPKESHFANQLMSEDNFQVLSCEHVLQLNELKYTLNPSFRKYLNETIYSEQTTKNCYEIYVQYMAILSRQLLKSIKDWNQFELN